jgi:hypothetical protein
VEKGLASEEWDDVGKFPEGRGWGDVEMAPEYVVWDEGASPELMVWVVGISPELVVWAVGKSPELVVWAVGISSELVLQVVEISPELWCPEDPIGRLPGELYFSVDTTSTDVETSWVVEGEMTTGTTVKIKIQHYRGAWIQLFLYQTWRRGTSWWWLHGQGHAMKHWSIINFRIDWL